MPAIDLKKFQKFGLIGSLYVSQYLPAWFLYDALPVFMRQNGASLETIGILPALALPITLSFLWSPLIDRYGFTRWGHYRFWIICFQLLVTCVTVVCAFLDVKQNFTALLIGMALMFILGASQDIATDALAVGLLKKEERGIGNAVQSTGVSLGGAIGGGGMLILLNRWGWTPSLLILASIMIVMLIPLLLHREVVQKSKANSVKALTAALSVQDTPIKTLKEKKQSSNSKLRTSYFTTLVNFCRLPGMGLWLLILVLYSSGSSMAATMFRPLLVDIGLSLADIGWLLGVVGTIAGVLGGIAAGFLIVPLGRSRSLFIFSLLWAISMLSYLLPAFGVTSLPILYLVAIGAFFTIGIMNTITFTIQMDKSRLEAPGTDYTMQNSIAVLGSIVAAAVSGVVAKAIGYRGVFGLSLAIAIISVLMIAKDLSSPKKT
jgi:MFS transporter, PAT family, beta-lactamase induction signal transducer AmpG